MKVRKLVVPVAGLGTRFLPITKAVPKAMLPILDKPVIHYILESALASGITDVCIILNRNQEMIRDYFTHNIELERKLILDGKEDLVKSVNHLIDNLNINYIYQDEPLGSGHALLLAKEFIQDEPFFVMYGDSFFLGKNPVFIDLERSYIINNANIIGATTVEYQDVNKYGMLIMDENEEDRILGIVEKPTLRETPSLLASNGVYLFKPSIFTYLEKIKKTQGEYLLVDAITMMMKREEFYLGKTDSLFYDIGNMHGYVQANNAAYKVLK